MRHEKFEDYLTNIRVFLASKCCYMFPCYIYSLSFFTDVNKIYNLCCFSKRKRFYRSFNFVYITFSKNLQGEFSKYQKKKYLQGYLFFF